MASIQRLIYLSKSTDLYFPSNGIWSDHEDFRNGKIRGILFAWGLFLVVLLVFLIIVIGSVHYSQTTRFIAEPVDDCPGSADMQIDNVPDSLALGTIIPVRPSKDHMAFTYAKDTTDTQISIYHYRIIERSPTGL